MFRRLLALSLILAGNTLLVFSQQPPTLAVWPCKTGKCLGTSQNGWVVGEIRAFAFGADSAQLTQQLAQAGWVECRGQNASVAEFTKLAATIGPTWGSAEGKYTFYLPDLRGTFLRGWQHDKTTPGDKDIGNRNAPRTEVQSQGGIAGSVNQTNQFERNHVGSVQPDAVGPHNHDISEDGFYQFASASGNPNMAVNTPPPNNGGKPQKLKQSTDDMSTKETHPVNSYVAYFIYVGVPATDIQAAPVSVDGKSMPTEVSGGCIRASSSNKKTCDFVTK